ncbi:sensor domain-containing diguanylate cyclase [Duganella qianjiadongensis]|uniref:Diguanylate cyclase n=1 Tax=Duganella qianjiadongensis TaxID=2692176 RepID=A0ABW9VQ14_9BURK|nr:sensor domain-containing diguanylate cyclase [Duganella qianjiadongensis]MYM40807.1 diguanylate cyclase [Duganella qianjiadongensis]
MNSVTAAVLPPADSLVRRLTRLNLRLLSMTMLLTFLLLATATWYVARERQLHSAELSARLLANSVSPMLVFADRAAAQIELEAFSRRSDLLLVQVRMPDGAVFAQWQSGPGTSQLQLAAPAALAQTGVQSAASWSALEVWAPIRLKDELVGVLLLRESLASLHLSLLLLSGVAITLMALMILVAWRGLVLVQRKALRPLVELSDLAEQIAQQRDYSQRATIYRRDEVGRLGERFNEMLKRIEIWQADLRLQLAQEHEAGQKFERLAHKDSLTGLPNRLFFQGELQRHLALCVEHGELMALMFIDLDNFKKVNDQYGHDVGDEVLCEVARRMAAVVRSRDVLCRLGGDEFALILPQLPDETVAEQLALRLIAAVRATMTIGGAVMPIGATVGLAFAPLDAGEATALLNASDHAMYAAKRAGKNTFRRPQDGVA